jgi:uncharacterized protein YuzE
MSLTVQFDPAADAAFIEIGKGVVAQTITVTDHVNIDLDAQGRLLSVEVLAVSHVAPSLAVKPSDAIAAE